MNRPMRTDAYTRALAWMALIAFGGALALSQDTVAPPAAPAAEPAAATQSDTRTDSAIESDVTHALDTSKALKGELITAATIQGEVTLSGTVSNAASSELAESIAGRVAGVTKVNNNLTVGNAQAPPMAPGSATGGDNPAGDDGSAPRSLSDNDAQALLRDQIRSEVQAQIQQQREAVKQQTPKAPVTVNEGTLLLLRTSESVNSKRAKDGEPVQMTVIQDVFVGSVLAIPRGATVHGVVSEVKKAGELKGSPELGLTLTSLELGGRSYPLDTDQFKVKGPGKGGWSANNIVGSTMLGTIIGCIAGRGIGCAAGAAAGAAVGTAASAGTSGPGVWIPSEAKVVFHLTKELTVTSVSAQEAARMLQGLYPGGPTLYRRVYPSGQPYAYYGYPPVYFHPYYYTGGYYYWQ